MVGAPVVPRRSARVAARLVGLVATAALGALGGCRPALVHCTDNASCGRGACVAGRCEAPGRPPAVVAARRLVIAPARLGYRAPGLPTSDDVPAVAVLGSGVDAPALLLAFDLAPLGLDPSSVVEAHVLLAPAEGVDPPRVPSVLHVARIVEGWSGGSRTSRRGPALRDGQGARREVAPTVSGAIRLDVRDLVRSSLRHEAALEGFAVVAEGPGMAVAVSPSAGAPPVLEIYAR